jgi:hypothetical protein
MLKKIGKVCIGVIMAFFLSFAVWYFLLIKLPKHQVQGTAAPVMSKEEAISPMDYHGIKVIRAEEGVWIFERDGKICQLSKKK